MLSGSFIRGSFCAKVGTELLCNCTPVRKAGGIYHGPCLTFPNNECYPPKPLEQEGRYIFLQHRLWVRAMMLGCLLRSVLTETSH